MSATKEFYHDAIERGLKATTPPDLDDIIRLQNDRARSYCKTCGGSGEVRVCVTGSETDFVTCHQCRGTGQMPKFKDRKNKERFNHPN